MDFAESNGNPAAAAGGKHAVVRLESITAEKNGSPIFADTDWASCKDEHWAVTGDNGTDLAILSNLLARKIPVASGRITYFCRAENVAMVSPDTRAEIIGRYAGYAQARWQSFEGDMCPAAIRHQPAGYRISA